MKIEVSNGELIDKIIILEIKLDNISNNEKRKNIIKELEILRNLSNNLNIKDITKEKIELTNINKKIWITEDALRDKEKDKIFDDEFITLARTIYIQNDLRAVVKKQINIKTNSLLIEEKGYDDRIN